MPTFTNADIYITLSTIYVHVDNPLIYIGFINSCSQIYIYVDILLSVDNFFNSLFFTNPYFIRHCELFSTTVLVLFATSTWTQIITSYFFSLLRCTLSMFLTVISNYFLLLRLNFYTSRNLGLK